MLFANTLFLGDEDDAKNVLIVNNGLGCRVCAASYRLHFVEGSEDCLVRMGVQRASNEATLKARRESGEGIEATLNRLSGK